MSFAMGMAAAAGCPNGRMQTARDEQFRKREPGHHRQHARDRLCDEVRRYGATIGESLDLEQSGRHPHQTLSGQTVRACGCVIASTGSACGLVYLRGGSYEQVCAAIKNMIGNITGMVCDGAKVGCAMKVASGVSGAVQFACWPSETLASKDGRNHRQGQENDPKPGQDRIVRNAVN